VAKARLVVESEQIPDELAASTVQTAASEQLQIIEQRILARDRLLEMANKLEIYKPSVTGPAQPLRPDEIVDDLRKRITIRTTGGTVSRGQLDATLVDVSFEAPTANLAATVTNEVVTLLLQEDVSMRTGMSRQTLDFFVQEVERLDQDLAKQGAEILKFKQENQDALPDSLEFRRNQQAAGQERLLQLERDEATLKDRRARLVTLFETTGRLNTANDGPGQTPEQRQLQELRDQLSASLAILSPQHPTIKVLEAQIAALEKVVANQLAGNNGLPAELGNAPSPYEIQLADIDGQLEFLTQQKTQINDALEALRISIEATPRNAIALDILERDYANLRTQYDRAVANKARAETGDMIEARSKGQRISVIEQAIPPLEPESPDRKKIAVAGVGGGLLMGLGLVVLLELMNSTLRRPEDLTRAFGITPFATLPYMRTRKQIIRRRAIIGLAFLGVLAIIPAGLWVIHTQYMPLDLFLEKVMRELGVALLIDQFSAPSA
jgi:uncharacterized protein involved in exopolysaccharide biosynthesis